LINSNITVIAMTWNRDVYRLSNLLWILAHQSLVPDQVIIVDQSPDQIMQLAALQVCDDYSVAHVSMPSDTFSMPKAFNKGLELVTSEYVMFTGIDMMFSEDFIKILSQRLSPNSFVNAMMGYYPEHFFMGNDNFFDHWGAITRLCDPSLITRALSPGACQAMSTSWIRMVNGYDERYSGGLGGIDDEMRSRAVKCGLNITWIEWGESQVIHQWHKESPLKGVTSHLFDANPPMVANTGGDD